MDTHPLIKLSWVKEDEPNPFDPCGGEVASPNRARIKRCVKDSRRVYMESILFKNELVKMTKKEAYRLLSQDNWDDLSNRLTFYFWTLPGEGRFTLFICQKE